MKFLDLEKAFDLKRNYERLVLASEALRLDDIKAVSLLRVLRPNGSCVEEIWLDNRCLLTAVALELDQARNAMMELGVEFPS